MSNATELSGATAVVTGASSGIGRAIAERLGEAGAHVVLCGRTASSMEESCERIVKAGGSATSVVADVRDPAAVQSLIDDAVASTGRLDILVNNAGVGYFGSVIDADVDQLRALLETNVLALLVGCQAAVRAMRVGSTTGHIVSISSLAARETTSGVYGATKHAVNVISNSLRAELIDDPIQVTTVMPGVVATNFARYLDPTVLEGLASLTSDPSAIRPGERLPDDALERAQAALGDFMVRPEDIAAAVFFIVTQPPGVDISEIVVRPNKDLDF